MLHLKLISNESTNHEIHGCHVIHNKIMEKKNTTQNNLIPTYKSTGVVISDCFGITKSLQKRIRLENDVFDFLWKYVSVIKNVSVMLQYAINSS